MVQMLIAGTIALGNGNGTLIRSSDNWRSDQDAEIMAATILPTNDQETALAETLPPGGAAYTAIDNRHPRKFTLN